MLRKKIDVCSSNAYAMQTSGLLELIDKYKNNTEITLSDVLSEFYESYRIIDRSSFYFLNQYQLISTLWTFIVLPKERYYKSFTEKLILKDMNEKWGLNKIPNQSMTFRLFLKNMRNAISHGNIEFNEKLEFMFWNINKKKEKDMELVISGEELYKFNKALAWWAITNDINLTELSD